MLAAETPRQRARRIVSDVAREHRVPLDYLYGPQRYRWIKDARYAAIRTVAAEFPRWSSTQLGRLFGRDHTTILHALGRTAKAAGRRSWSSSARMASVNSRVGR